MRIKILHIIKTLNLGGAQTNLLNLVLAMNASQFENHVAYSFGGELEPKFKAANMKLFKYADNDHKVKSLETVGTIARLVQYILSQKIQIVHTHTFSAHIWGSIAAKLTGCKIVEHVHDFRYLQPDDFVHRRGFNNQYRFIRKFKNVSDRVVVLTKQNKDFLIREGIYPAERIYEYHNGIPFNGSLTNNYEYPARGFIPKDENTKIFRDGKDTYKKQLSAKFGFRDNALIILTPIRITPEKNVDLILRIAPEVIRKMSNAIFLIAGDGPQHLQVLNDIKNMNLEENVRLIGYHADIHFLLKGTDIFFLPSFLELHSIAILEAMSVRVPIVTSEDVGCNSEFIDNWKNGVLLDPFKDEGWAEAIIKLLEDPQLRQKIGDNGYKMCQQRFNIITTVKKFENLYNELTSR